MSMIRPYGIYQAPTFMTEAASVPWPSQFVPTFANGLTPQGGGVPNNYPSQFGAPLGAGILPRPFQWQVTTMAPPSRNKDRVDVTLVVNNDRHEHLRAMPYIITAFITLIKQALAEGRTVLALNAGDNNVGTDGFEWRINNLLMNLQPLNAMAMGNHELDMGTEKLLEGVRQGKLTTPIL